MRTKHFAAWIISMTLLNCFASTSSFATSAQTQWRLVWSDEFDQPGPLDPTKWDYQYGGDGWGNGELQNYTDRLENARVENGNLVIEVRKEEYEDNHYTSARIHSLVSWQYGRIDIRAKVPGGQGAWPAIWALPSHPRYGNLGWPDNGEIDIMEYAGRDPGQMLGSIYSKNYIWSLGTGLSVYQTIPDIETEYHVYSLEWNEKTMSLLVDGLIYNTFENPKTNWEDWPFDQEYQVMINLAVGGWGGDVDDSIFPRELLVDYIRVYQEQKN